MKRFIAFVIAMMLLSIPVIAQAKGDIYEIAEAHTYKNANTVLAYRLILPENYDDTKEYPIVVFFHGAGERGNDNKLQFFHLVQYIFDNAPDCIILAPQCPINNQWVDTPWANGAYSVDKVAESNEMVAVMELLDDTIAKYNGDTDRVYAIGLSMGGFATWDIITRHNDVIAAGIPICGGGDPSKAELLKDTPIFTFHAVNDTSVPYQGTKQTVDAIKNAGGKLIEYTEYTTGGHGIWNQAIQTKGLLDKLFECKLSDRYPTESDESKPEESADAESKGEESVNDESVNDESVNNESVNDESVNDESAPEQAEEGFWNAKTLTLLVSVVVAGIITALIALFKKKKKA